MTVSEAKISGSTVSFKAAKRMEFEMTVQGADTARLKFVGTASEDNPWTLSRVR